MLTDLLHWHHMKFSFVTIFLFPRVLIPGLSGLFSKKRQTKIKSSAFFLLRGDTLWQMIQSIHFFLMELCLRSFSRLQHYWQDKRKAFEAFFPLTGKSSFELSQKKYIVFTIPSVPLRAVVMRISIRPFHYLLMCIISLQMSQLNNMVLAMQLYRQIQSKPSLSQSIHSSLWLSWDLWCSNVLPHFQLKAAAVYQCSHLKAANLLSFLSKNKMASYIYCIFLYRFW